MSENTAKDVVEVTEPSKLAQDLYFYIISNNIDKSKVNAIVDITKMLINWEKEIRLDQIDIDGEAMKKLIRGEVKPAKNNNNRRTKD